MSVGCVIVTVSCAYTVDADVVGVDVAVNVVVAV